MGHLAHDDFRGAQGPAGGETPIADPKAVCESVTGRRSGRDSDFMRSVPLPVDRGTGQDWDFQSSWNDLNAGSEMSPKFMLE